MIDFNRGVSVGWAVSSVGAGMGDRHIGGLDLIRFSAALLVVMVHIGFSAWARDTSLAFRISDRGIPLPSLVHHPNRLIGVEIFFVISGLVIAKSANGRAPYMFLVSRIGRLMPAIWICATTALVIVLAFHVTHWKWALYEYARTLVVVPDFPWIDEVYWTLAVEIVFYAINFPVVGDQSFPPHPSVCVPTGSRKRSLSGVASIGDARQLPNYIGAALRIVLRVRDFDMEDLGIILLADSTRSPLDSDCLHRRDYAQSARSSRTNRRPELPLLPQAIWMVAVVGIFGSLRVPIGNSVTRRLGLMTYPLYLLHDSVWPCHIENVGVSRRRSCTHSWSTKIPIALAWLVVDLEKPARRHIEWVGRAVERRASKFGSRLFQETAAIYVR